MLEIVGKEHQADGNEGSSLLLFFLALQVFVVRRPAVLCFVFFIVLQIANIFP